ncbi:50S ribosomal protein L19 [Desulfohalobiaceae bacterium Ax17]|jgi:large subunit ribosomal protein L19|uniref:50S ribosomal protein L19 n=1 Tax=Desulfovulcanus ferrireducens TaxID=2831190 RepID=UPI00207BB4F8|nr:50S ribosomal protein L19 [Desulfovulcanus ferrireducens]MBT8764231.1 50S ribosomal protein L19 [Desulfovulcanus ferrireducens]
MNVLQQIEREQMRMDLPKFKAGDTVRVHVRIIEGEKERIQVFQGIVLRVNRGTTNATFVVRKISDGIGVERVFPMHSPFIERIEVVSEGKVRQGRIYYLRGLKGKAARIKSKETWN